MATRRLTRFDNSKTMRDVKDAACEVVGESALIERDFLINDLLESYVGFCTKGNENDDGLIERLLHDKVSFLSFLLLNFTSDDRTMRAMALAALGHSDVLSDHLTTAALAMGSAIDAWEDHYAPVSE